jgi:hypothetical protein
VPWVFLLRFGRQKRCADAKKNAFDSGFVSDLLLAAGDSPCGESFFAAYRPAGTREALPGTMRGICVLRFDRKGTMNRVPTKKILARVLHMHALKNFTAFSRTEAFV